nr:MAG TPA: CHAP domain protein [Caudoviricetes sp.]
MTTLRVSPPATNNKYYTHTSYGGVNECIRINGGQCLPNCVGYCWGAWYEMMGKRPNLSRRNAKEWYGYTADGYARSRSPELGAVACWGGGQYGHVAIVVGIFNGYITVAQSNYGGNRWELVRCYKYGNGYKSHGGNTHFQGFILLPQAYKIHVNSTPANSGGVKTGFNRRYAKGRKMNTKVNLNLRDYPANGKVRAVIPKNQPIYWYGYYAITNNIVWYYVAYGNKEGYVYGGKLNSGVAPYVTNANP